jgi:RNA polymerase sigma-B factor
VPRPLKEQALRLCRATDELHQRLGRSPTTHELAEELGLGEEEVLEAWATMTSRQEVSVARRCPWTSQPALRLAFRLAS